MAKESHRTRRLIAGRLRFPAPPKGEDGAGRATAVFTRIRSHPVKE